MAIKRPCRDARWPIRPRCHGHGGSCPPGPSIGRRSPGPCPPIPCRPHPRTGRCRCVGRRAARWRSPRRHRPRPCGKLGCRRHAPACRCRCRPKKKSTHGRCDQIRSRQVAIGPETAERRNGRLDQSGIDRAEPIKGEPQAVEVAGGKAFKENVRRLAKPHKQLLACLAREIQGESFLPGVVVEKLQAAIVPRFVFIKRTNTAQGILGQRLEVNHLGAQIGV